MALIYLISISSPARANVSPLTLKLEASSWPVKYESNSMDGFKSSQFSEIGRPAAGSLPQGKF